MPTLDVTELLSDPDFVTSFTVTQRTIANVEGYAQVSTSTSSQTGVVLPMSTQELVLLPESQRVQGQIKVYTTFHLTAGDSTRSADSVNWRGNSYLVQGTNDFTEYGIGFVEARCALVPVVPT